MLNDFQLKLSLCLYSPYLSMVLSFFALPLSIHFLPALSHLILSFVYPNYIFFLLSPLLIPSLLIPLCKTPRLAIWLAKSSCLFNCSAMDRSCYKGGQTTSQPGPIFSSYNFSQLASLDWPRQGDTRWHLCGKGEMSARLSELVNDKGHRFQTHV